MQEERDNTNDQDARTGGYGGSTGGQAPAPNPAAGADNGSAAGRDNPGADTMDSDEALGNRSGGYGSSPRKPDAKGTGSGA